MRSKSLKAIISVILVFVISIVSCTSVFAATSKERYISDIVVCNASSADDAKTQLEAEGYKLMTDSSLSSGMYIGYKTTNKRSEAITNISAMNMNGKYSFTDYQTLLTKMKENVSQTVAGLIPMITNYRENYEAGTSVAIEVHDILNKFFEDDSETYMGDYLLSCDLADTTDLTKVFMQGYSAFIVDIQQLLFLAGESSSDQTWMEKMAAADPDYLEDTYINSYATPNKAMNALAADYGNAATSIRTYWDTFATDLKTAKETYFTDTNDTVELNDDAIAEVSDTTANNESADITTDSTEDEFVSSFTTDVKTGDTVNNVLDVNVVEYLNNIEYDGGTMLDFFMRDSSEVEDSELYTLAYYMGKDLSAQVGNVGLEKVISRVNIDSDEASKDDFADINASLSAFDKISIYEGVDRSLFEDGVAITSATTEKFTSSGKSWSDGLFSRVFQPTNEYKWQDYFAFYVLPLVSSVLIYTGIHKFGHLLTDVAMNNCTEQLAKTAVKKTVKVMAEIDYIYNAPPMRAVEQKTLSDTMGVLLYNKGATLNQTSPLYRTLSVFKCAFFVLTVAMIIISAVMLFITIFTDNEAAQEYTSVPNHIVDTISTENGDDYIAYNFVPNLNGSAGDLENYAGKKGWLCLFYTKDSTAGEPLTADMKVVTGSTNAPMNYDNLSMFGETNAIDLTSKDYTGVDDSANGTYLYFKRASSSSLTASAFANASFAIALGVGSVAGILLGIFLPKPKKKEKKATA